MSSVNTVTIYLATSPSGAKFVGSCSGKVETAWRQHEHDAGDMGANRSTKLNAEIRMLKDTGGGSFQISVLEEVDANSVTERKEYYVKQHGATLNLKVGSGGRKGAKQSTREKMSESHKKRHAEKNYGPMDKVTKNKISKTLTKDIRIGHDGNELPKYVRFTNQTDRRGYIIWGHPAHPARIYFVKATLTLDQNRDACIAKLKELNEKDIPATGPGATASA